MKTKIILIILLFVVGQRLSFAQPNNYITLDCKTFKDGTTDFYPMVLNYEITLHEDNGNYYVTPRDGYHPHYSNGASPSITSDPWGNNLADGLDAIEAHLQLIANHPSMKFNTIRLTGFGAIKKTSTTLGSWFINDTYTTTFVQNTLAPLIEDVLDLADDAGLRVILLTGANECESVNNNQAYTDFLETLAGELSARKTILGYDFYNEPVYEDAADYTKQQTKSFVEDWYNAIKDNAPDHLTTIGLLGFKSAHEWDPDLMKVDFISFHPYPTLPVDSNFKRYDSQLYWISRAVNTPWIVGETGFLAGYKEEDPNNGPCPAVWDSQNSKWIYYVHGDYSDQSDFIENSLLKVKKAGGSGYSWWNFQDQRRDGPSTADCSEDMDYWGLIDHTENVDINITVGSTTYDIPGALKNPNETHFDDHLGNTPYQYVSGPILSKPTGYYNYYGRATQKNATGYVYDEFGESIEDAIIFIKTPAGVPLSTSPASIYLTFSESDGSFDLKTHYTDVFDAAHNLEMVVTANKCEAKIIDVASMTGPSVGNITLNYIETNEGTVTVSNGSDEEYTDLAVQELSTITLNNGSTSKFIAEKKIHIKPGFSANSGATSHLYIDDLHCPSNTSSNYSGVMPLARLIEETKIKREDYTFSVYPNPNTGIFNVRLDVENVENLAIIEVYDLMGKQVFVNNVMQNQTIIDITNQPKGIYIVKITVDGQVFNEKIIYQ